MSICAAKQEIAEIMASEELSTLMDRDWEILPTVFEREAHGICANSFSELHRCGDALFTASESLLDRVRRDDASPYAVSVSRIHHLAATLREQLTEFVSGLSPANGLVNELSAIPSMNACELVAIGDSITDVANLLDEPVHFSLAEIATEPDPADPASSPAIRPPRVLVIDESSFIRMLLNSAIETVGHATLSLGSLKEAESQLNDSQASDIVIWGGVDSPTLTDCLTDWIRRRDDSRRPMLIGLVDGMQRLDEVSAEFNHVVCRAHLQELLSVIRDKLGDRAPAMKKTA